MPPLQSPEFVRNILHRVNLPFFRIVLSTSSGEPREFQSNAVLTRAEGPDAVMGNRTKIHARKKNRTRGSFFARAAR
jgi:hypothetical protein